LRCALRFVQELEVIKLEVNSIYRLKRKTMKKQILFMLITVAVCGGCSEEEGGTPGAPVGDGVHAIAARYSVEDMEIVSSQTRQAFAGNTVSNLKARVMGSANNTTYTPLHSDGFMTFTDGNTIAVYDHDMVGGYYWYPATPADPVVNLSGLYPAGTKTALKWTIATPPTATFPLTGCEDVMYAETTEEKLSVTQFGTAATLAFKHRLTYIRLLFQKESTTTPITVTKVVLKQVNAASVNPTININLSTKVISYNGTATATFPCYIIGGDVPYSTQNYAVTPTASAQAYVLAPASTGANSGNDYMFTVSYTMGADKVLDVPVELATASTSGLAYDITFKFMGGEIKAKASITAWPAATSITKEIS
jgi:hypothetical protein